MAENRALPIRICYICRVQPVDTYPGALRCRRCNEHPTRASLEQRALGKQNG